MAVVVVVVVVVVVAAAVVGVCQVCVRQALCQELGASATTNW